MTTTGKQDQAIMLRMSKELLAKVDQGKEMTEESRSRFIRTAIAMRLKQLGAKK